MKKTVRTTCALDCHDACGIEADVEDGRIVRLRGAKDHPYTRASSASASTDFLSGFTVRNG